MFKHLSLEIKNVKQIKKLPLLFLGVFLLPLLIAALPIPTAYAATTATNDLKRRKLETFKLCLAGYIDEGKDIYASFDDFFNNDGEKIVVGFDRDSGNAVQKCKTVTLEGLGTLGSITTLGRPVDENSTDPQLINAFSFLLNGSDFTAHPSGVPNGGSVHQNNNALEEVVDTALAQGQFSRPNNYLRKKRIFEHFSLVEACYNVSLTSERTGSIGTNGFSVTLEGGDEVDLKPRGDGDIIDRIKAADFIKENGHGTYSEIGNLPLGFGGFAGVGGVSDFNGFGDSGGSDFYPIGKDIGETNGYTHHAIVDCGFVRTHKAWLEQDDIRLEGGTLVLYDADGTPINRPGGTAEDEPSCEENYPFSAAWVVCLVLGWVNNAINSILNTVDSLLSVGIEEINAPQIEKAWSYFRNLASFLLVLIGLVMIIGQAISKE